MPTIKNDSVYGKGNAAVAQQGGKSQIYSHQIARNQSGSGIFEPFGIMKPTSNEFAVYEETPNGKVLKGATLAFLIEKLTQYESPVDTDFTTTFLLTYRTFVDDLKLATLLRSRFQIVIPVGLNRVHLHSWVEKVQKPIRLRVIKFLKLWIESFTDELRSDKTLIESLLDFVRVIEHDGMEAAARQIAHVLDNVISAESYVPKRLTASLPLISENGKDMPSITSRPKLTIRTRSSSRTSTHRSSPSSILPRSLDRISLMQIDPLEMARQLTLLEWTFWVKVRPCDLLKGAWSKSEQNSVRQVIDLSNRMTFWVASTILSQQDIKQRCLLVKHFILVADRCRGLNNFNSLMSILAALNSAPLSRLSRTWEALSTKAQGYLKSLQQLMMPEKNFARYRAALSSITATFNSPSNNPTSCIPFLGMYLTDLTMIEDGNKDYLDQSSHALAKKDHLVDQPKTIINHDTHLHNMVPSIQSNGDASGQRPLSSPSLINTPTSANDIVSAYIDSYFPSAEQDDTDSEVRPELLIPAPQKQLGTRLINWTKRHLTANVLAEIQMLQSEPYNLLMVSELQQYLQLALQEDVIAVDNPAKQPPTPNLAVSSPDSLRVTTTFARNRGISLSVPTSPLAQPNSFCMTPLVESSNRAKVDELIKSKARLNPQHTPAPSGSSINSFSSSGGSNSLLSSSTSSFNSPMFPSKTSPNSVRPQTVFPPNQRRSRCPSSSSSSMRGMDLYELSLDLEPRERTEEKITRLLQESGFL